MILPPTIKFKSDFYYVGDSYMSIWAIKEYPPSTEEQAILSQIGDRNGVTLHIYNRLVSSIEQRKIVQNATRKNKLQSTGNNVNETIEAEGNLQDVTTLMVNLRLKQRTFATHSSIHRVMCNFKTEVKWIYKQKSVWSLLVPKLNMTSSHFVSRKVSSQ